MKYIRTKDGIYTLITKDEPFYELNGKKYYCVEERISSFSEDEVIKQSEIIEELCDEFRGIWINYYESKKKDAHEEYLYDEERNVFYAYFDELTHKEAIEKFDIFYGAIWTDRGLIYVAKINDKGELELL